MAATVVPVGSPAVAPVATAVMVARERVAYSPWLAGVYLWTSYTRQREQRDARAQLLSVLTARGAAPQIEEDS